MARSTKTGSEKDPRHVDASALVSILDGPAIRTRRQARGLSLAALADLAGIPGGAAATSRLETQAPAGTRLDTLARLALALECHPADLLRDPRAPFIAPTLARPANDIRRDAKDNARELPSR